MERFLQLLGVILAVVPLLVVAYLTFQVYGIDEHGGMEPNEWREQERARLAAERDSLLAEERLSVLPENEADSILFGVSNPSQLFEEMEDNEEKLNALKAALDSIAEENRELEQKRRELIELTEEQRQLAEQAEQRQPQSLTVTQEVVELSKIYNEMKPKNAAPLFAGMNDTLAVMLLDLMDERNSAKVMEILGSDSTTINKSLDLSRLMAETGIEISE